MIDAIADTECGMPEAARELGKSTHQVYRLLRQRPDIDDRIRRAWGRRLFTPADLDAIRRAFEAKRSA